MSERTRPWLLGLTLAFALGVVLGAATVSRGTAGRSEAVLARLAEHLVIVDGPLNGVAGPHVIFEGVNVHIRSGAGSTDEGESTDLVPVFTGLGNLIVGYNEPPNGVDDPARGGSHTLVVGRWHQYTNAGGLVAGQGNTVTAFAASVSGGATNTASGMFASVSGGNANTAKGTLASVSGGQLNTASGGSASVSGGNNNTASGIAASVSGGAGLSAPNANCWRAGGLNQGC